MHPALSGGMERAAAIGAKFANANSRQFAVDFPATGL
jgi:hypothetical protein